MPDVYTQIYGLLESQINQILNIVSAEPGAPQSPFILLPSPQDVDSDPASLSAFVAITSNEFAKASRLAGICRAMLKLAEGQYKQRFKTALGAPAKNARDAEAAAHEASKEEYNKYTMISALVELAESWESACRIASESARRMLLTVDNMRTAEHRMTTASQDSHTVGW